MSSTRCGISAKQLERELGVTYKCAWRMFNRIRSMLEETDGPKLSAKIEVDEGFFGGKETNKHLSKRRSSNRVRDTQARTILPHVRQRIMPQSMIFTDEAHIYRTLRRLGYGHERVYHSANICVDGEAHVNTMEGFWSLTKNGIRGVYHSVSEKHLQSYLNEYGFRFNRRKSLGRRNMFNALVNRITKKVPASV